MRFEGLWGSSPAPVWPGSVPTALVFVGLPVVTILVLLATPLHDPGPPPLRRDPPAAVAPEVPTTAPRIARAETATAALPRAAVNRGRAELRGVPAVIYEPRRPRHRSYTETGRAIASASVPAVMASTRAPLSPQSP